MTQEQRMEIAARAMCALIAGRAYDARNAKKQLVDNAIAYADLLGRRLEEIPPDAQQRSEAGARRPRIDWEEIHRIADDT